MELFLEQLPIVIKALNVGFLQTLKLFFVTLLGAFPLGLIIAFGSMSKFKPLSYFTRIIVWIIRGTPLMIQLLIIYYMPGLVFKNPIWGSGEDGRFLASAIINNMLNFMIGKMFVKNPDGKLAYAMRSYISTFIGQFLDNFIFSVIVFTFFAPLYWGGFRWTLLQCAMCALTGAVFELIMEVVFSPIGYKITKRWQADAVGAAYLACIQERKCK